MKVRFDIKNLIFRPWRLVIFAILLAIVFVYGRLILFSVLGILFLIAAIRVYFEQRKSYFGVLSLAILIALILGIYYIVDYKHVSKYIADHSPLNPEIVLDGTYQGEAEGLRGPIKVQVTVSDGKIQKIDVLQHQEMVAVFDSLDDQIIAQNSLSGEIKPATIHGSIEATQGYLAAVNNALWQGVPDKPEFSRVTKILNYFAKFRLDLPTFNALAILFAILLVFDYTIQSTLVPGTGQALNCYNCQTCVGVCPVKIVDGEPYPMTMILAARLGNYEKVKYLAKFCVACSRCAGKCPVGDSGPSIAAAAISFVKKEERRKALLKSKSYA